MGKDKIRKQSRNRFEVGTYGGCKASLFEFREKNTSEPHVARIAAMNLGEALAYLHWHEPDFEIGSVQNLGVITMVSGSPVD